MSPDMRGGKKTSGMCAFDLRRYSYGGHPPSILSARGLCCHGTGLFDVGNPDNVL
jgi:hypothetical protein